MVRYLARRFLLMIVILFIVSVIIFSLVNVLPGDPARLMLGQEATPEALAALRKEMGLNDPLYIQYLHWVGNILHGDFGYSLRDHSPVLKTLLQKIPVTLELTFFSFVVAILIALPVGILSATRRGRLSDYLGTFFALSGISLPSFWLGILLIYLFAVKLKWFPPSGYVPLSENFGKSIALMILPAITLGTHLAAELTRMLRSSLLDVLQSDYIRTAYAKGLLERAVVIGHALKNALVPVLTVGGLQLAAFFGGSVITETIFGIPGIGQLVVNAILTRDFPVVQACVLFMAFMVVVINFLVDIAYSIIDPRIKLGEVSKG
ncbi:nickel ABC transporter permease [Caenibacillus caldisaponilyticus]|jgi:peptide/nickel transport system permease protein|uniref:nickel ABC transporter permease n=1 Tax=Caenibacillus caldisaponilyticus TaxID=1674942 RepID=UPI00098858EC|nr:nickel ABC transporter permease [Caenibacillus caldisaponilyticus]